MPLDLDTIANSRMGLALASAVGRGTPRAVGMTLASVVAQAVSGQADSEIVRALRVNQWVASGCSLRGDDLDEAVRLTLRSIGTSLYDLYHLGTAPQALAGAVDLSPAVLDWIGRARGGQSLVIGCPHLSNFDLGGRALAAAGLRAQVLSVSDPTDSYRSQNRERISAGLDVTPISLASLRAARERLERGGAVLTGIDRPLEKTGCKLCFFGREALLPDVHVRLALSTGAPLILLWVVRREDGRYEVHCEDVPTPRPGPSWSHQTAEEMLARASEVIAANRTQWAMPHAVWPEALAELEAFGSGEDDAGSGGRNRSDRKGGA